MPRTLGALAVLAVVLALSSCEPPVKEYRIGDTGPAGGIVFYDKGHESNGWRYMEVAPGDQGVCQWGSSMTTGATGTAVGTGKSNTAAIVAAYGTTSYAGVVCSNYDLRGHSDWFLPSNDELTLLMQNLQSRGLGDFLENGIYWSSTEYSTYNAWSWWMDVGLDHSISKISLYRVRPIRQF
jgi:hypothetical protein